MGIGIMVGGIGWLGKNAGIGCSCWNTRSAFDYYGRSFAPELHRYSVLIVDSGGNALIRIGQYGNADTGGEQGKVKTGGDEVGLMHGAYIAVASDQTVFIADPGNARIISVDLDYHEKAVMDLK